MKKLLILFLPLILLSACATSSVNKIAILEIQSLVTACSTHVWESYPSPEDPGQAVEFINKCMHMYATLDETKLFIEEYDYSYVPSGPRWCEGISCVDYKNPDYPYLEYNGEFPYVIGGEL
jgi:hypothetical protein